MSTLKTNNIQHVDRSEPSILINTDGSVNIAGTMTYEDVTNVDSVGVVTARKQLHVGTGVSVAAGGLNVTAGVSTFSGSVHVGAIGDAAGEPEAPLHVTAENSQGINAIFGAKDFVDNSNYNYADANIALQGRDADDNDTGAGVQFTARTTADNNWLHGAFTMGQDGQFQLITGGSGTSAGTEKIHITTVGAIGIGTDSPDGRLHVHRASAGSVTAASDSNELVLENSANVGMSLLTANNSLARIKFGDPDATNAGIIIYSHVDDSIRFQHASSERIRIDSAGALLVAHTSGRNNFNSATSTEHAPIIQLEGTNQRRAISVTSTNNNDGGILMLARQNGNPGANTVVSDGNQIGRVDFQASGGTNMEVAAQITAEVDGTPGDNDMPGRLLFKTTADGANSASERIRINASGNVAVGTAVNAGNALRYLDVANFNTGSSAGSILRLLTTKNDGTGQIGLDIVKYKTGGAYFNNYETDGTNGFFSFGTGSGGGSVTERMRILAGGQVNIGNNLAQTSYGFSVRGGAVDQNVQFSTTKSTNGNIHYFGITLTNAGYGQALFGHTGHTTQSEQAVWMGMAGDDVAGGVGVKCFRGGSVIKKGQPAFMASAGADSTSSGNYMIFTTENFDVRGDYNNSTGVFTAPIAGKYLFTLTGLYTKNNASPPFKLTWHVNNSNAGVAAEWQDTSISNSYNTIGNSSIIFDLSANDTVRLYVEGSTFHCSGIQTRFCGYLLG